MTWKWEMTPTSEPGSVIKGGAGEVLFNTVAAPFADAGVADGSDFGAVAEAGVLEFIETTKKSPRTRAPMAPPAIHF